MWTSADAIETKCAIKIAGFAREMEIRFATTLTLVSAQTIMSPATGANIGIANFDFERRHQRRDKLELADGTNVFTKARATKKRVNNQCNEDIIDDQPGRPNRPVPEAKDFITPKKQYNQSDAEPF